MKDVSPTGRTVSLDFETQWPSRIKKTLEAPPGHVFINVDFSQAEIRTMAIVGEEAMRKVLRVR